jgi:DNA polymerase III epsilon subunit-like protein
VDLVAIDLEGSGAQDRDGEAILEIALVPIIDWEPDMASAYCTLINPQRPIPQRPWISPGLTTAALRAAPTLAAVEPELARRINGKYLVGHNIDVDWRLLHGRCPTITPAGLIDTLRLCRKLGLGPSNRLSAAIDRSDLTDLVNRLAAGSTPHRALWDTTAVALLLPRLAHLLGNQLDRPEIGALQAVSFPAAKPESPDRQLNLFD